MKHWHEFDIQIVNLKAEEEADKLGISAPEPELKKIKIDLALVAAYYGTSMIDGRDSVMIETRLSSFQVLMSYEEFDALIQEIDP